MKLVDAAKRNAEHPDTFNVPTEHERQSVPLGHYVKIGVDDRERMWFKVVEKTDTGYVGTLSNDPVVVRMKFGDRIEFTERHIMDICSPRNAQ